MINYQGKWAIVTGATAGIGECFARELAKKGANLILVARRKDVLEKLSSSFKSEFNIQTAIVSMDLSSMDSAKQLFEQIKSLGHPINILINNAGIGVFGQLDQTDLNKNQQEMMLNVFSLTTLTQLVLPEMLQAKDGIIINVASTAAFQPLPYMSVYGATKAFVLSFTEALWAEYNKSGLHILAVCPGPVDTQFFKAMGTEIETLGKKAAPAEVVKAAFNALESNKMYVIPGVKNYVLAQSVRFVPRKWAAKISEKIMRPK